ncbi:hypothetical protein bcgnr5369_25700 [Bacillus cereus]
MKKVYKFNNLSEKAKKRAVEVVHEQEINKEQDWTIESREITENLKYIIKEEIKLDCDDISWEEDYGISIDLSSVSMTEDYLKKVLSKEEYDLLKELESLTDNETEHKLFDNDYNKKGYVLFFDYIEFDEAEAMEFIMNHSEVEEIKAKYKFPLLLEATLSSEEYNELEEEVAELGRRLATKLSEKVNPHILALVDRLKKIVQDGCDYLGTEEYYHDQLEADCSPVDTYLFNYQGELILIDGEYVDSKFEEIYHDCEVQN